MLSIYEIQSQQARLSKIRNLKSEKSKEENVGTSKNKGRVDSKIDSKEEEPKQSLNSKLSGKM